MFDFSLGVLLESFKLDSVNAMKQAAKLGLTGIQVYAISGETAPENMNSSDRKEFRKRAEDCGLKITALCGDLGHGFSDPEYNVGAIEKSKRILDLAKDLGTDIVTTHIGVVPSDSSNPRYSIMQEACSKLACYADSMDAHFAVETGPETPQVLKPFLDSLNSKGVAVNFDPANLAMSFGKGIENGVYTLKNYIVHTHAKDGVNYKSCDPEILYGLVKAPEDFVETDYCEEVPLGKGIVDWDVYLKALDDIGYHGYLTIEREVGENPAKDIELAVNFLNQHIK